MGKTTGCRERTEPEKLGHAWIRGGAGGGTVEKGVEKPYSLPCRVAIGCTLYEARKHFLRSVLHKNNNM